MKQVFLTFFCGLTMAASILAQNVGINNPTPAASALLDLTSTDKGLLVPRMTSVQRLAIPSPATGLMVYETTTNQFFYFNGTSWISLTGGGGSGWLLTGNAGTNSTTNFVGTTDNVPFNIKVNNEKAGRIENTTGNSFFGYQSGNVTTGSNNSFFGKNAGLSNTSGYSNVAIGIEALRTSSSNSNNVAVGDSSLRNLTTGNGNIAIGSKAGLSLTTTNFNSFFGTEAGRNSTGFSNSFFGWQSGILSTGSNNSFFGILTGGNSTGDDNTFIGNSAGNANTSGSGNTFVGGLTGLIHTTGSFNTLIGNQAATNLNNLTNATAIGANARVDQSNSLILGSVAGINGATTTANVGIGTTAPGERLEVLGKVLLGNGFSSTDGALMYKENTDYLFIGPRTGSSNQGGNINLYGSTNSALSNPGGVDILTGGSIRLRMLSNGNVGIGTATPLEKLEVSGRLLLDNGFSADNGAIVYTNNTDYLFLGPRSGSSANGGAIALYGNTNNVSSNPNGIDLNTGTISPTLRILANGNVGIGGVTNPAARLHVAGNIRMVDGNQAAGKVLTSDANGTATWQTLGASAFNAWGLTGNSGTVDGTNFIGTTDLQPLIFRTNNLERARINPIGNMGVGTLNPLTKLDVAGTAAATVVGIRDGVGGSSTPIAAIQAQSFGGGNSGEMRLMYKSGGVLNEAMRINQSGNVGIGIAGPNNTTKVHVFKGFSGAASGNNSDVLILENSSAAFLRILTPNTTNSGIVFDTSPFSQHGAVLYNHANKNMSFLTSGLTKMTLNSAGNLGIGTTVPTHPLHVVGKIRMADGTQAAGRVLTSDANGTASWQTLPAGVNSVTASNGLASTGGTSPDIQLGGTLNSLTDVNLNNNNLTFSGSGNIGIGTITPQRKFHVLNSGTSGATPSANATAVFENNTSNYLHFLTPATNESGILFGTSAGSIRSGLVFNSGIPDGLDFRTGGNIQRMVINSSGNVGIGIATPSEKLHVVGNLRIVDGNQGAGKVLTSDANGTATWQLPAGGPTGGWSTTGNSGTVDGVNNFIGTLDSVRLNFIVNNNLAGRIDHQLFNTMFGWLAGQSVTTGQSNTLLGVAAGGNLTNHSGNTFIGLTSGFSIIGDNNTTLGKNSGGIGSSTSGVALGEQSDISNTINSVALGANSKVTQNNSIVLGSVSGINGATASVNVGIGTTAPIDRLDINGHLTFSGANKEIRFRNTSGSVEQFIWHFGTSLGIGAGSAVNSMFVTSTGNLGIGTSTPSQKFHVIGNGLFTGTVTASCGTLACSDLRYKKNISPLSNTLSKISNLSGIYYDWKKEEFPEMNFNDNKQIGIIAQELEKEFPELVHTDENGFKTVDYARLTPVLLEAIKELKRENDELKINTASVNERLKALEINMQKLFDEKTFSLQK